MTYVRALSAVVSLALLVHCSDEPGTAAAAPSEIEIRATVAAAQTATAIAAIDGRIATLSVQEGATVKPGQLIATIANPSLARDLTYAKAQVVVAEARLRDARRPIAQSLILGDAGARERAAAEILQTRQARRDRYRELYKSHDVTKQELEDAETAYSAALRDWLGERERASMKVIQTDTSVLQIELEKAKSDVAFLTERMDLLNVRAPIGGVVTRVAARPGESVFTRDPIAEIANTSSVDVHGQVAPELLRYVRPGMPVEVKILTVPPRRMTAPIRTVVPGSGGAVVVVQVPNPDGVLQAGQSAVLTVKG